LASERWRGNSHSALDPKIGRNTETRRSRWAEGPREHLEGTGGAQILTSKFVTSHLQKNSHPAAIMVTSLALPSHHSDYKSQWTVFLNTIPPGFENASTNSRKSLQFCDLLASTCYYFDPDHGWVMLYITPPPIHNRVLHSTLCYIITPESYITHPRVLYSIKGVI
jgi:hypothetical protein